jgi:hypothetical protein
LAVALSPLLVKFELIDLYTAVLNPPEQVCLLPAAPQQQQQQQQRRQQSSNTCTEKVSDHDTFINNVAKRLDMVQLP